jgi:hypothetical protein
MEQVRETFSVEESDSQLVWESESGSQGDSTIKRVSLSWGVSNSQSQEFQQVRESQKLLNITQVNPKITELVSVARIAGLNKKQFLKLFSKLPSGRVNYFPSIIYPCF